MQDIKSTTIHSRSFDEKHLQIMKKHNPTLVVNLPMINSTTCQTIVLQEVAPHSKREENQDKS
jgi:hypothetical protein